MTYKTTITQISIHAAEDSPVFGDSAVLVGLDDHGGGPFLTIENPIRQDDRGRAEIDINQWPAVAGAVARVLGGLGND